MIARAAPPADVRVVPGTIDPATWPHTRSFLAILEESGLETARAQFLLTHAEAETVCAWANAPTRKNPTVIIMDDDPETEDFRPSDPGNPAGSIGGSAPPSAAADVNALAVACAYSATAAAHDLINFMSEGGLSVVREKSLQVVTHLADALDYAIELHRDLSTDDGIMSPSIEDLADFTKAFLRAVR